MHIPNTASTKTQHGEKDDDTYFVVTPIPKVSFDKTMYGMLFGEELSFAAS